MGKASHKVYSCAVRELPASGLELAARAAIEVNPVNAPRLAEVMEPARLAVLTTKYWGQKGVRLTVGFIETTSEALRNRIISHMNAWQKYANVEFTYSQMDAQVRISRGGGGYWSYLGTDILQIPKNQPTMNLEGFIMATPESEFVRVVRHETGHTLGFPHDHLRKSIIDKLDRQKTISYFQQTQGWSREDVISQVLTPLEETSLIATPAADQTSIMTYMLPGVITKDGKPIPGGADFSDLDKEFAAKVYPRADSPIVPPNPPVVGSEIVLRARNAEKVIVEKAKADGEQVFRFVNAAKLSIDGYDVVKKSA